MKWLSERERHRSEGLERQEELLRNPPREAAASHSAKKPRLEVMDWVAIAFAVAGVASVVSGLLPFEEASGTVRRVFPLLVFLGFIVVLAELTAKAEVFNVIAARAGILARGNYVALFVMCVVLATVTTTVLNLDTTAVLLTPVMLAIARVMNVPPMPLAMTTVWLANTASLLLPVSNLTNLLAMNRVGMGSVEFAGRMLPSQLASVLVTMACLWLFYWRRRYRSADRYTPPPPHRPRDRWLFGLASAACSCFIVLLFTGVSLAWATVACSSAVVLGFLVRDRSCLHWRLIPFRLLGFVTGLFLVVQTIGRLGLSDILRSVMGVDPGVAGTARAALVGAGLSNLINNLPSYVAGEAGVLAENHTQLLGLLIGTNVGPIVAPWASLATLLWYEGCKRDGVTIPWRRFIYTGAVTASVALTASVAALLVGHA